MKTTEIKTLLYEYASESELDVDANRLMKAAKEAVQSAYAPYSGFRVGAAVLLKNGVIVKGSNQENAAYPSGLCAERVALFSAGANHPGIPVVAIAITVSSKGNKHDLLAAPCGACRQVMSECEVNAGNGIRVLMTGEKETIVEVKSVNDLLPLAFKPIHLK